jgi:hypothetical protein
MGTTHQRGAQRLGWRAAARRRGAGSGPWLAGKYTGPRRAQACRARTAVRDRQPAAAPRRPGPPPGRQGPGNIKTRVRHTRTVDEGLTTSAGAAAAGEGAARSINTPMNPNSSSAGRASASPSPSAATHPAVTAFWDYSHCGHGGTPAARRVPGRLYTGASSMGAAVRNR